MWESVDLGCRVSRGGERAYRAKIGDPNVYELIEDGGQSHQVGSSQSRPSIASRWAVNSQDTPPRIYAGYGLIKD
jgi:hypothetical protein